ncbi:MAG: glycosyltransferase family 2 protein [Halobacteriota archaeon]
MKTVAVIPCYNEEELIGSVVLKARGEVDEVLVVDDGSTDATVRIASAAGAKVISHAVNEGKGAAIRTAFRYVAGNGFDTFDTLVLLDGDAQNDPNQIPMLIKPVQNESADMVIGFRNPKQMPLYRRLGRRLLDYTTGIHGAVTDSQSGFRALNRRAVVALSAGNLRGDGYSIESEMAMAAEDLKLKIQEVPITGSYGNGKTSTKNPVSHGVVPGLVLIFIGFFFGLKILHRYNNSGYFSIPFMMLAGFFIVIGALSVFMGLGEDSIESS